MQITTRIPRCNDFSSKERGTTQTVNSAFVRGADDFVGTQNILADRHFAWFYRSQLFLEDIFLYRKISLIMVNINQSFPHVYIRLIDKADSVISYAETLISIRGN